jgi:hypothetical protein
MILCQWTTTLIQIKNLLNLVLMKIIKNMIQIKILLKVIKYNMGIIKYKRILSVNTDIGVPQKVLKNNPSLLNPPNSHIFLNRI